MKTTTTIAQLIIEKSEKTTNAIILANNLADVYLPERQVWVFRDGSKLSVDQVHDIDDR